MKLKNTKLIVNYFKIVEISRNRRYGERFSIMDTTLVSENLQRKEEKWERSASHSLVSSQYERKEPCITFSVFFLPKLERKQEKRSSF